MTTEFWTEARIADLRRMICFEGLTFEAAGRELGISKNACIGKAHRLGLARDDDAPLSEAQRIGYLSAHTRASKTMDERLDAISVFPSPGHCLFPIGNPGDKGFHFCGDRVPVFGAPYCHDHMRVCYVPASKSAALSKAWTEDRRVKAALAARQRAAVAK